MLRTSRMSHVDSQEAKLKTGLSPGLLLQRITLVLPEEHLYQRKVKPMLEGNLTHR